MDLNREFRRGDVYIVDLDPIVGSEQGGRRPVVVISNNNGNHYSPTLIVAPISTQKYRRCLPTHVRVPKHISARIGYSAILLEQIRTIDKSRVVEYLGKITWSQMAEVDMAILISLGLLNMRIIKLREQAVEKMKHKKYSKRAKET